jgi:hypothetical protein
MKQYVFPYPSVHKTATNTRMEVHEVDLSKPFNEYSYGEHLPITGKCFYYKNGKLAHKTSTRSTLSRCNTPAVYDSPEEAIKAKLQMLLNRRHIATVALADHISKHQAAINKATEAIAPLADNYPELFL